VPPALRDCCATWRPVSAPTHTRARHVAWWGGGVMRLVAVRLVTMMMGPLVFVGLGSRPACLHTRPEVGEGAGSGLGPTRRPLDPWLWHGHPSPQDRGQRNRSRGSGQPPGCAPFGRVRDWEDRARWAPKSRQHPVEGRGCLRSRWGRHDPGRAVAWVVVDLARRNSATRAPALPLSGPGPPWVASALARPGLWTLVPRLATRGQ
jgi:hypothetical protein